MLTFLRSFFSLFYTLLFTFSSVVGTAFTPYTKTLPTVPDDFESAVRFVVFSDNHGQDYETYCDGRRVVDMVETCYSIYGDDGIDLFVDCGDFTEFGTDAQTEKFIDAFYGAVDGKAQTMVILGNHDLKSTYDARDHFLEKYGIETGEQSFTVNGFHFIGIPSYTKSAIQIIPETTVNWAASELAKAEKDTPDLPVFTFQHPHNRGTVYGSMIWGCDSLNRVWEGHSNVVNFSGHSHFPISDPRSIWQGSYTAVGAGAMARWELEKDLIWSQHPDGYDEAAEFWVVEADMDGSVKMSAYDLNSDTFFLTYYIDNVNDSTSFAYTYKNMQAYDSKPVFPDNVSAECAADENGEYELTFDRAANNLVVQNYKIEVKNSSGVTIQSKTYLSDYFMHDTPERFTINLGTLDLESGEKYTVKIIAASAYGKLSKPLTASFTA